MFARFQRNENRKELCLEVLSQGRQHTKELPEREQDWQQSRLEKSAKKG